MSVQKLCFFLSLTFSDFEKYIIFHFHTYLHQKDNASGQQHERTEKSIRINLIRDLVHNAMVAQRSSSYKPSLAFKVCVAMEMCLLLSQFFDDLMVKRILNLFFIIQNLKKSNYHKMSY